jgi:hypothetical protein
MNNKGFAPIVLLVVSAGVAVIVFMPIPYFRGHVTCEMGASCPPNQLRWTPSLYDRLRYSIGSHSEGGQRACSLEAMLCPDGSSVGRTAPNCEFAACPTPNTQTDGDSELTTYTSSNLSLSFRYPSKLLPYVIESHSENSNGNVLTYNTYWSSSEDENLADNQYLSLHLFSVDKQEKISSSLPPIVSADGVKGSLYFAELPGDYSENPQAYASCYWAYWPKVTLSFCSANKVLLKSHKQDFDKMLSSFKFSI